MYQLEAELTELPDCINITQFEEFHLVFVFLADKSDPKPGGMTQEVGQLLQDMGDDVYQQYRSLTRQSSDFDTQSGFSINVSQFQPPFSISVFLVFRVMPTKFQRY